MVHCMYHTKLMSRLPLLWVCLEWSLRGFSAVPLIIYINISSSGPYYPEHNAFKYCALPKTDGVYM